MKFFLPILTVLVILATIINLSISLQCHNCSSKTLDCTKKDGGNVADCLKILGPSAVACYTTIFDEGTVVRGCVNQIGVDNCLNASKNNVEWKCHPCYVNACNNEDKL